jgi:hypothetical protein
VKLSLRLFAGLACSAAAAAIGIGPAARIAPAADGVPDAAMSHWRDVDYASWAADPAAAGSDLPALGRSLFDHLVTERQGNQLAYRVPFPFPELVDRIQARLAHREFSGGSRIVMVPMGRSLQRTAAAPDFFKYSRIVFAVTGEPRTSERDAGALLKDRIYIGYVEKTATLEVISYNELAGRFEFQLVKDYRAGAQSKVFYANRMICVSCHQNHAPIFSRAIWGETNANARVADLLGALTTQYQLSLQANVDFPDDIEKSAVRANALVALQTAWRQGCAVEGDRTQSRRCRAAAFTALLQYGLSSGNFDSASPAFQQDFVASFARAWRQRWPQGLSVAQSSLPDRNPLGAGASAYGGGGSEHEPLDWIAASHVPAQVDPLNPRAARETWRFSGAIDSHRFVAGWVTFFATDDFRALDAHLVQQQRQALQHTAYRAQCTATRDSPGAAHFRLQCASPAAATDGANLGGQFDDAGNGRIDWLNLGRAGQARELAVAGKGAQRVGTEHVLHGVSRKGAFAARLPDGRALASVEIRLAAGAPIRKSPATTPARLEVVVLDDFALVREAIGRLLAKQPSLFDDGPLVRSNVMPALFSELGMYERSWCCVDDSAMQPAAVDVPELSASALEVREWQPMIQYCAVCHLTREQFPPNFLAGDVNRVAENLRHCAPRILVRLSAWGIPEERRVKCPMPPATVLRTLGTTHQQWPASDELHRMRAYVESLLRREGRPSDVGELLQGGYEALPRCLAEADQNLP